MRTCLSISCPERTGGECNAHEKISRFPDGWMDQFRLFYDDNEAGGSSRWMVSPDTVERYIEGLLICLQCHENVADHKCPYEVRSFTMDSLELPLQEGLLTRLKRLFTRRRK